MYRVTVKKLDDTVLRTEDVLSKRFIYPYEDNANDNGGTPIRSFKLEVVDIDDNGNASEPSQLTVNNPPPAPPISVTTRVFQDIGMQVTPSVGEEIDVVGMKVWLSKSDGFTPNAGTLVYDGNDLSAPVPLDGAGTYYFRIALIDSFDRVAFNISEQFTRVVTEGDLSAGVRLNSEAITAIADEIEGLATASAVTALSTQVSNLDGEVSALSSAVTAVEAQAGSAQASASSALSAVATTNGKLASTYALTLGAGGKIAGIKAFNDGSTSTIDFLADKFRVSNPSGGGVVTPFRVEGGTVFIDNARINSLGPDNLATNSNVSIGGLENITNVTTTSSAFTNMPGMTGLIRQIDEPGIALIWAQIGAWVNDDQRLIEVLLQTSHPTQGTRLVSGTLFMTHRFPQDDHQTYMTGIALLPMAAGSHTFNMQWRVSGGRASCNVKRLSIIHFKNASFSGLVADTSNGAPAGPSLPPWYWYNFL